MSDIDDILAEARSAVAGVVAEIRAVADASRDALKPLEKAIEEARAEVERWSV